MRVAVFHDYFGAAGGGERLALALARGLGATVYTTDLRRETIERLGYPDVPVVSLGATIPRAPLKQVVASARFAAARADADAYVLSGNWAVHAARRHHPNVAYCHTPVRAFYDLRDVVLRAQRSAFHRAVARGWIALHGAADRIAWSRIDRVVTNSENTRARIRRYHRRDATVVHPPTDLSRFRFQEVGDFWLSVNRLYPEKRVEMQIEAFRRLPGERLVVAGGYAEGDLAARYATSLRPPRNVTLLGEVGGDELLRLYATCRGLVCTARDEDFGMTPVEAMASGKIVLAVDEGGYRETIVPGETGFLLPADPEAFASTILSLRDDDLASRRDACRRRAERFGLPAFLADMRSVLREAVG